MDRNLGETWDEHMAQEFVHRDVEATLATMVEDAHIHNIPSTAGGVAAQADRPARRRRPARPRSGVGGTVDGVVTGPRRDPHELR